LNRGKKRRSVSTLSIPRALDRGVEWVDFIITIYLFFYELSNKEENEEEFNDADIFLS
jgi:hypothetical protein